MIVSESFKKYFVNTTWFAVERLIGMTATLVVGLYIARYLGPERFGQFCFALSFVALFSFVANLGLDQIAVREFVEGVYPKRIILGTIFFLRISGAVLILILFAVFLGVIIDNRINRLLIWIISASFIFDSFNIIDLYFQSQVLAKYAALANVVRSILSSTIKVLLVINGAGLIWFAVAVCFDSIILAAILYLMLWLHDKKLSLKWSISLKLSQDLLIEAWPLAISGLVATLYMKIDQVMLMKMTDSATVGLYGAAARISEAWYFIPTIMLKSLFPAIINLKKNCQNIYKVRLQQLHDMLSLIAIIISLVVLLYSNQIIFLLFGEKYLGSAAILSVHIWAGLMVFPGNIRAHLVVIENRQIVALIFRSIGAVLNIILNYIFIPKYGAIGAAWATLASFAIPVVIVSFFDHVIRMTVLMTLKSYFLLFRLILYRKYIYRIS